MSAYQLLEEQPDEVKQRLIKEFGSLQALYDIIYQVEEKEFKFNLEDDLERLYYNRYERFKIEKTLEKYGVEDAMEITWEIGRECAEKIRREYFN